MGSSKLPPTRRGYSTYEVVSAYQKAIRRSDVDGALYWGAELYRSGFANWAWKRLRIIVSEDIGPAAPGLPADVYALEQTYRNGLKADSKPSSGLMYFVHATVLAARAPKCRICDWALFAVAGDDRPPDRDVPDEALDMHTLRGKQLGRGAGHFVEEAGKLVQPDGLHPDEMVDSELQRLEKEYEAVFREDQSRWRDPLDTPQEDRPTADPEAESTPTKKPKVKKPKTRQPRLLP